MTFALTVDGAAFEKHLKSVIEDFKKVNAQVVPVIKGNGYGFGRRFLASQTGALGLDRIAIGTVFELDQALTDFGGQIVVLEPFNPADASTIKVWEQATQNNAHRIVAVIASDNLASASRAGIKFAYLEGKTSTHRFGFTPAEMLYAMSGDQHNISIIGINLHLPIADPVGIKNVGRKTSVRVTEITNWLADFAPVINGKDLPLQLNLSHVSPKDISHIFEVAKEHGFNIAIDVRLGTSFWLGNQKALNVTGTVLEIHELTGDHEHVGYRQVDGHGNARLLVVSGGTAHGVALAAPTSRTTLRAKGVVVAEGFAQLVGKVRSPFKLKGKNLTFAEPPHMHVSLLWCEDRTVKVGDELECTVRNTTSTFDVVNVG